MSQQQQQGQGEDTSFLDLLASVVGEDESPVAPPQQTTSVNVQQHQQLDLTALFAMDDPSPQPAVARQQVTPQQRQIAHPLSAILAQLPADRHPAFMAIYQQFHVRCYLSLSSFFSDTSTDCRTNGSLSRSCSAR